MDVSHEENILERIADFCANLNEWNWSDYLSGKPEGFDDLPIQEKAVVINKLRYKLKYMLNDTANTLIDWSAMHKFNGYSFDEYLDQQLNNRLIDPIPDHPAYKKKRSKIGCLKRFVNKGNTQKDQKQE